MILDRLADLPRDNIIQLYINKLNDLVIILLELNVHSEVYNSALSFMKYGCSIQVFEMLSFVPNSLYDL